MSGGSFEYLCFKDAQDLVHREDLLLAMADRLSVLGYGKAAQDTRNLFSEMREFFGHCEQNLALLQPVWQAVEWQMSGDWGLGDVKAAVTKYEAASVPLSVQPEGFSVQDFHRELIERKIKLQEAIHKFKKERNHNAHRNAAARLDEIKRTERMLRTLSPGCDQCVDGTITEPAMKDTGKEIKLTVISYRCVYCESMKNGREENG